MLNSLLSSGWFSDDRANWGRLLSYLIRLNVLAKVLLLQSILYAFVSNFSQYCLDNRHHHGGSGSIAYPHGKKPCSQHYAEH